MWGLILRLFNESSVAPFFNPPFIVFDVLLWKLNRSIEWICQDLKTHNSSSHIAVCRATIPYVDMLAGETARGLKKLTNLVACRLIFMSH